MPEASVQADDGLERALRAAAPFVAYPDVADLAAVVSRRLREDAVPAPARRRWTGVDLRRAVRPVLRPALQPALARAAIALALIVTVLGGTLVFSPSARRAVAGWLGLRGVKIEVTPSSSPPRSPTPLGFGLDLGTQMTLAQAQAAVPFRILIPADLGAPDEVYLRTGFIQDQVTLLYRARPGLPRAATTGAGLLLTEFRASIDDELIEKKVARSSNRIETVRVNGGAGYWIEGAHDIYLIGPDGEPIGDSVRLAGNVLLWEQGDLTLRIEAEIAKEEALRIAESVR
jgi:hypothetical protein